jgi:chemosensory pili system protein ChpA (sensor histidine kinase/response regulator)
MPTLAVLLVEPDGATRDALTAALTERLAPAGGLRVYPVGTGAEALSYLQRVRPTLVILDVELPDMDGLELCRRLRHDSVLRRVPVLVVSRLTPVEEVGERATAAGGTRFFARPVDLDAFADEVRALLPAEGQ